MRARARGQLDLNGFLPVLLNLYQQPLLYDSVFPIENEDVQFFCALAGSGVGEGSWLLDAGCGGGLLGARVADVMRARAVGVDRERKFLRDSRIPGFAADIVRLPFQARLFDYAFSRLFAYSYEIGARWEEGSPDFSAALRELARTLKPQARVALEVPLAHVPAKLVGLREIALLPRGGCYEFLYLDVLRATPFGAILDTRIAVESGGLTYEVHAPLHVFTPEGAAAWFRSAGLEFVAFCASYDSSTQTLHPPVDCLRGVAVGHAPA